MHNSNEISLTTNFVYVLQTSSSTQVIDVASWILDNTSSIASGLSFTTLVLLLLAVQIKANIYRREKIKTQRAEELESEKLSLLETIEEKVLELEQSKGFSKLPGKDRDNFLEIINSAEQLRKMKEELQIERKDGF